VQGRILLILDRCRKSSAALPAGCARPARTTTIRRLTVF
jgi:hypothetical protein